MSTIKKPEQHWYKDYFSGLALNYLKAKSQEDSLFVPESTRVLKHLNIKHGGSILDVLCGFGFHANHLARNGYHITGVDAAQECIQHAQTLCPSEKTNFICSPFEEVTLPTHQFDGAYCLGNSYGYLNKRKSLLFFQNIRHSLKSGAKFILHTSMIEECLEENLSDQVWEEYNNVFMLQNNDYDEEQRILKTECTFLDMNTGKRASSDIYHYISTLEELAKLLDICGLPIIELLSHDSDVSFTYGDAAAYIVCRAM